MIKRRSESLLLLFRAQIVSKRPLHHHCHPLVVVMAASLLQQHRILHTTAFGEHLPLTGKISLHDSNNGHNHTRNKYLAASTSNCNSLRIRISMKGCSGSNKRTLGSYAHGAFPHSHVQQVLRDFEIERLPDAELPTVHDDSHRGKLLGFPPCPLPEKIVVAVDVDEGISHLLF